MSPDPGPQVPGIPVTARNWQDPPVNRWAYWHVRDILPTYRVSRGGGPARPLPGAAAPADLLAVEIIRIDGSAGTVGEVLAGTYTDAYVVLQNGELVTEWYGPLGAPDRAHALMSVSKSVLGCVAAVLIDRGQLDAERVVTDYVPELAASGYAGATVRNVLDMRSGVRFLEEYANPQADIRRLDEWIGWQPGQDDGEPRGLYRYLATLGAEAPHGSRFLYRSAESDVLGWVCERAAGQPMAELMSALVWAPMGAEHDADLLHDGLGAAVHDGGLCATARDVARFGQMLLDGGAVPDGAGGTRRVVPPRWLRQGWAVDADARSRLRRLACRGVVPRRLVPQPVLVPARRARRRPALPGHPRPDGAREPPHEHGVREVLHLAPGAEPGLHRGDPAGLRCRGRGARRTRSGQSRPGPEAPGGRGIRPEPAGRHRSAARAAAERDLRIADRARRAGRADCGQDPSRRPVNGALTWRYRDAAVVRRAADPAPLRRLRD